MITVEIMTHVDRVPTGGRRSKRLATRLLQLLVSNPEMVAVLVSAIFIIGGWVLARFDYQAASAVSFLLAFAIGGYAKGKEGVEELIRNRQLDVNMLMIFAAIGSALIGYWAEGAILIFIFALSGALETYTMDKSNREIKRLMALQPEEARLYENGVEKKVPVAELKVGQTVVVKPGDRVPADGTVIKGATAVDQSAVTGESVPVEKKEGDEVLAGTINGNGWVLVRVDKAHEDTLFQRMIRLVQQAQTEKPPQQYFIERFEKTYVYIVLIGVALMAVLPPYVFGWTWNESIYRAMVLLVVASPCALVASIMPVLLSAISNGARRGVLFKGGTHLQKLEGVRVVAFDKTGTLTTGVPQVQNVKAFEGVTERELLQATASIENMSSHPLADAIVQEAVRRKVELLRPEGMESVTGFGVLATIDGVEWKVGKRELMDSEPSAEVEQAAAQFTETGKTVVYVQKSGQIVGLFAIRDAIRPHAAETIKQLKEQGIYTVMLTGDSLETARAIAKEIGVDAFYANCLPDEKVLRIRELRETYGEVVMIGDGVNDAPALASATVGIGMGAGTDVALETSDVVLVKDELLRIPYILRLAKKAGRVIKQNIAFSVSVIVLLIAGNFLQSVSLPLGVVGHEGSTILVILNGIRLLSFKAY